MDKKARATQAALVSLWLDEYPLVANCLKKMGDKQFLEVRTTQPGTRQRCCVCGRSLEQRSSVSRPHPPFQPSCSKLRAHNRCAKRSTDQRTGVSRLLFKHNEQFVTDNVAAKDVSFFKQFGYAIIKSKDNKGVKSVLDRSSHITNGPLRQEHVEIDGRIRQFSLAQEGADNQLAVAMMRETNKILTRLLGMAAVNSLSPGDVKLLVTDKGDGLQALHQDDPIGPKSDSFTSFLFLSKGLSAAMPLYKPCDLHKNKLIKLWQAWEPSNFISFDIEPGDCLIFSQKVIHSGITHPLPSPRQALFLAWQGTVLDAEEESQNFFFQEVSEHHGKDSVEYAIALTKWFDLKPQTRLEGSYGPIHAQTHQLLRKVNKVKANEKGTRKTRIKS